MTQVSYRQHYPLKTDRPPWTKDSRVCWKPPRWFVPVSTRRGRRTMVGRSSTFTSCSQRSAWVNQIVTRTCELPRSPIHRGLHPSCRTSTLRGLHSMRSQHFLGLSNQLQPRHDLSHHFWNPRYPLLEGIHLVKALKMHGEVDLPGRCQLPLSTVFAVLAAGRQETDTPGESRACAVGRQNPAERLSFETIPQEI